MTEGQRREQVKRKSERRRQRHRSNGLCLECTRRAVPGKKCCSIHLAMARIKFKQEYEWRIAHGVCVKCGSPKELGRKAVNCLSCAEKAALRERRRRALLAAGLNGWQGAEFFSFEMGYKNRVDTNNATKFREHLLAG